MPPRAAPNDVTFPDAVDPAKVGTYPTMTFSGGGYVWDEILEYRVWHSPFHDDDFYTAFATYADAEAAAYQEPGAEDPVALVLQREYIDEPTAGDYRHVRQPRVTEWPVAFLARPRCDDRTIPDFLAPVAPQNRLDILRGTAPRGGPAARGKP